MDGLGGDVESADQDLARALRDWHVMKALQQAESNKSGMAQAGNRSAVTGGRHLAGVNRLIVDSIEKMGVRGLEFRVNPKLPGFYRPWKSWDLLVSRDGTPLLVVEYKSMGSSEGKNLNNRADEVFGVAEDAREAERHGLLPADLRRAYVFIMAMTDTSTRPLPKPKSHIGHVDDIFDRLTYLERMAVTCRRMRETGLYDLTWAVGVRETPFGWEEPDAEVGWQRFRSDLRDVFTR